MNFPYETEKSYLYGGNCLIMEVNPSVPNKPISKKSRIFASDYQYMETDIITVSDFEMRPVDYMLARSIEHAKAKQTKMYAISLGGKSAETSYLQLCDKYWEYSIQSRYLQPIITQYFIDNKSEIWLLFLIAHSKR